MLLRLNVTSSLTTLVQLTLQDNNNANALTSDLPLFNIRYVLALLWGSTCESLLVYFFFSNLLYFRIYVMVIPVLSFPHPVFFSLVHISMVI